MFDTSHPSNGWVQQATCPGLPRTNPATAVVGGQLYIFGGNTGNDNSTGEGCDVVDDWKYNPSTNSWTQLQDMPVACGTFTGCGQMAFDDRYVLMVGTYQYANYLALDGSVKPAYGTVDKADPSQPYYSSVFVYDTLLGTFGTATMLPVNNCCPVTAINGDEIYMIGNEIPAGSVVEGESYGHVPALYLTGVISVVPEPGTFGLLSIAVLCLLGYGWRWRTRQHARAIAH